MEEGLKPKYEKAIRLSDEMLEYTQPLVRENVKILDLAEKIEKKIFALGAKPAWPVNISIDEIAAHYTPEPNEESVLKEGELVKVDFGLHIDGCIADRAFTVCLGQKSHPLIETSQKALAAALKAVKSGVKVFELSEIIEETVISAGFNPIRNLSGHGIEPYNQHAEPSIPNGKNNLQDEIRDQVIALEVFVTDGRGWVKDSGKALIYRFQEDKPARLWEAKKILALSQKEFARLPFCQRWIKDISPLKMDLSLRQLVGLGALDTYPPLKEESNGRVAVSEETRIVA